MADEPTKVMYVERDRIVCVWQNKERYLAATQDPILIVLPRCPNLNSRGFRDMPPIVVREEKAVSNVIRLSKKHVECLGNVIDFKSQEPLVKLDLSACP